MSLILYHAWASTCSQKVRLCLAEKGVQVEERVLDLRRFEQLAPDFLALNPEGMVPVLVHEGFVLRESSVIDDYLDELFPDPPLRPHDPRGRARVGMWNVHIDTVTSPAIKWPSFARNLGPAMAQVPVDELERALARMPDSQVAQRWRAAARGQVPPEALATSYEHLRRSLGYMQAALGTHPWLAGPELTLADLHMLPFVHRMTDFPALALAQDWPRVWDWYQRLRARPSFARARLAPQGAAAA